MAVKMKIDGLARNEAKLKDQIAQLEAEHKDKFEALSQEAAPSEVEATVVAALALRIKANKLKLADVQASIKAERENLESPEVKKTVKEIARITSALDERRQQIVERLTSVFPELESMTKEWENLVHLRDVAGWEKDPSATYEPIHVWIRGVQIKLAVLRDLDLLK